jgi:hypothetical protein
MRHHSEELLKRERRTSDNDGPRADPANWSHVPSHAQSNRSKSVAIVGSLSSSLVIHAALYIHLNTTSLMPRPASPSPLPDALVHEKSMTEGDKNKP